MGREHIEKFFHALSHDQRLQRALLKRSRTPAEYFANAVKFSRLLGYSFSVDELADWAREQPDGRLPCELPPQPVASPAETITADESRPEPEVAVRPSRVLTADELISAGASRPLGQSTILSIRDWLLGGR